MTRRLVRLSVAANHPGVVVVFDARSGQRLDQIALTKIAHILGHRSQAFFMAVVEQGKITLYDEVPQEVVNQTR